MSRLQQSVFSQPQRWLIVLALFVGACGGSTAPSTPSAPTSPSTATTTASVTSVSVACAALGDTHQCTATARLSDGSTQNVTSQATWTSSNTSVATVDSAGLVRHRITGQTEVRADYRSVVGSTTLDIAVTLNGLSVVINEFATRGIEEATDDFIELRNDTASPVDISGWHVNEWRPNVGTGRAFNVPSGVVIGPGCHYLIANRPTVRGLVPDARLIDPINDNGGLALTRVDGSIVDQIGYHPGSPYREGTPMPSPGAEDSRSYARVGNDTNNNISDFVRQASSPLNSTSSCSTR